MKFKTVGYVTALVILLVASSYASTDYSKSCKTPAAYNGSTDLTVGSNTFTCDTWFTQYSTSGQPFNSVSWASATCSDFSGNEGLLNMFATTCCSDGMSVCAADYSGSCLDPSKFSPTTSYASSGSTPATCQSWYDIKSGTGQVFNSIDWDAPVTCSTFSTAKNSNGETARFMNFMLSGTCCTDGKSACHTDFSSLCKTPSTYTPTGIPASFGGTYTCDDIVAVNSFVSGELLTGTNFSAGLQCSGVTNSITKDGATGQDLIVAIATDCCSDGKSICEKGAVLKNGVASSYSMHQLVTIPLFSLLLSSFF